MFYCYYYAGKGQGKAWIQRLTQRMVQVEGRQLLVNTASMKGFNNNTVFFECVIIHSSS